MLKIIYLSTFFRWTVHFWGSEIKLYSSFISEVPSTVTGYLVKVVEVVGFIHLINLLNAIIWPKHYSRPWNWNIASKTWSSRYLPPLLLVPIVIKVWLLWHSFYFLIFLYTFLIFESVSNSYLVTLSPRWNHLLLPDHWACYG